MRITILGSGGGEGYPAIFCECEHCKAARKAGGKSLRSLSQAIVDDKLLIDLPAATHAHCLSHGFSLGSIEHLLITHTHADHWVPSLLDSRGGDYAHGMSAEKLRIYGNREVKAKFDGVFGVYPIPEDIRGGFVFHEVVPFEDYAVDEYKVTPLKANHAYGEEALNYIISDGKRALLYLVDSGFPYEETLDFLRERGQKFDCVVMDATMGENYYVGHMNFAQNEELRARLLEMKLCDENTRFAITHITHNHAGTHEEVEARFAGSGIEVTYDGYSAEF